MNFIKTIVNTMFWQVFFGYFCFCLVFGFELDGCAVHLQRFGGIQGTPWTFQDFDGAPQPGLEFPRLLQTCPEPPRLPQTFLELPRPTLRCGSLGAFCQKERV